MPSSGDTCDTDSPSEGGGGPTCERSGHTGQTAKRKRGAHPDVPLAPRKVRPQHTNYSPLQYVHSLLVKACGYTYGAELDLSVVNHLHYQRCSSVPEVRRAMLAIGRSHTECTLAPAYACAIGVRVPEYDHGRVRAILDRMEEFLDEFHSMRENGQLPFKRFNEPHTGTTIRRVAHMLDEHGFEPVFRDLKPKQFKTTGRIIQAVFHSLGWPYAEPCQ